MLTVLSGEATKVAMGSDITYAASAQYGPIAQHNHAVTLRIDGKPVYFRTRTMPSISEGDVVGVAGSEKNGTLQALALRNLSTGAVYCPPTVVPMVLAVALIVLGIPLIAFLGFGLVFCGMGAWVLMRCLRVRKAGALLRGLEAPVGVG